MQVILCILLLELLAVQKIKKKLNGAVKRN